MGIYVYGLRKNTVQHPVFGEVGVFRFLHKPAPWHWPKAGSQDRMREGKVLSLWKNRTIPEYVMREDEPEVIYRYTGKSPVWFDSNEKAIVCVWHYGKPVGLDSVLTV